MLPVLFEIGPLPVRTHDVFVLAGVGTAVLVMWVRRRGKPADPRLALLVAAAIFSGAVFAKLGTGWQYLAYSESPTLVGLWLRGGQSVLGGLAGAYVGVLVAKRIIGYQGSTGDIFAPAVAAGLAVGRIGCFLTEQVGTPTTLPWGISLAPDTASAMAYCPSCTAGLPMHPSFLYEIGFHTLAFVFLAVMSGKIGKPGDSFKLYLIAYALFRFGVEFVRDNPEFAFGLSGSQIFLLATVPLGLGLFAWKRRSGPRLRMGVAT